MPPCAQNVEPEPSWLFERTATLNVLGSCSARLMPAAPLPTINTSYLVIVGMFDRAGF
jgi:hypothetical protein